MDDPVVNDLRKWIDEWKSDASDVTELFQRVERHFGNRWIQDEKVQKKLYRLWSDFRVSSVESIEGLTMNERLYSFGLFERFDDGDDAVKNEIYRKLLATT